MRTRTFDIVARPGLLKYSKISNVMSSGIVQNGSVVRAIAGCGGVAAAGAPRNIE